MLAVLLSPIYVLVQVYIVRWLMRWLGACRKEFRRFRSIDHPPDTKHHNTDGTEDPRQDKYLEALELLLIDLLTLFQNESRYGIYACYGNHDIKEKILAGFTFGGSRKKESDVRMDAFLEKAGITLLR